MRKGAKMKGLTFGFWDVVDRTLRWIGKCTTWFLVKRADKGEEDFADALVGGGLVCAVFGGVAGFALSDPSRNIDTSEGVIIGCLLGLCMGIFLGSFVETVDNTIKDLLRSLNSK